MIFTARHKTGALDLEAVEMALRAALQQAGAAGLSRLLRQESPAEPYLPCSCGGQARYKGMRTKPLLTVLGRAEMQRAITGALAVSKGNSPPTRRWMWRTPSSRLGYAAC